MNQLKPQLLFIGGVRDGLDPMGGEEFKNRLLLPMLRRHFRVVLIDTALWRKDPRVLFRIIKHSFFKYIPDRILISASSASTYQLLRLWHLRPSLLKRTVYMVVGGYLPGAITAKRFKASVYQHLSAILVQGKILKDELARNGLKGNVAVVPNFKPMVPEYGTLDRFSSIPPLRCVLITRLSREKGLSIVFKAMSLLSEEPILMDIYGPIDPSYKEEFKESLQKDSRCVYKGFLDLLNDSDGSYKKLSSYHLLLFPTHWEGEGFPGVILDAYLAGLPVIASDWNMNREVVANGETGWLIPARDPQALLAALKTVLSMSHVLLDYSRNARARAVSFDSQKVFEEDLLPIFLRFNDRLE